MQSQVTKVIYDFGANNGDDVHYYLKKGDRVIAVEANPELCAAISDRFLPWIRSGQLVIENCVLDIEEDKQLVDFYIHKTNHVLSQFPKPSDQSATSFTRVLLPARRPIDIINQYGSPYYIKIDLEHYDHVVLKSLFDNNIIPPYLSVECHSARVLGLLLSQPNYNAYKLVDGASVSKVYENVRIRNRDDFMELHSFPSHSTGPFGDDLSGDWICPELFVRHLAIEGFGWKDIHVTTLVSPNPKAKIKMSRLFTRYALKAMRSRARKMFNA